MSNAAAAIPPATEWRPHPGGAAGAKVSLEKCAERIRKDYVDPLVVAFARRVLQDTPSATSTKDKAQAELSAMKARARYILDPVNSEYIAAARLILCLDSSQKDYCHAGGDCDELTCTLCSMLMAVGIECKLVGQCFNTTGVPSHVLLAAFDPATETWFKIDPSTSLPAGQSYPASSEVEVDPLTGAVPDFSVAGPPATFVGVGYVPVRYASGAVGYIPVSALGATGATFTYNAAYGQSVADLNAMLATIQAGDMYLQYGQYASAIQAYQAAGQAGATVVGPDIDLAGAPNTTQPLTQPAWVLNGQLADGLWLINGQLVTLASSPTYQAAVAAQGAAKQMAGYYKAAITAGSAALKSANPNANSAVPGISANSAAAIALGGGIAVGLLYAIIRSRRAASAPPPRAAQATERHYHRDGDEHTEYWR